MATPREERGEELLRQEDAVDLDTALSEALGDEGGADDMASLLGDDGEDDEVDAGALMDSVYAEGRRVERIGESVLMVSENGLRAFFKGALPAGTTYEKVMEVLERAGISYGIKPVAIHAVLPRKQARRKQRTTRRAVVEEVSTKEMAIAEGLAPTSGHAAEIEYLFHALDPERIQDVAQALEGVDFSQVKNCPSGLSFAAAGQVLARVAQDKGKSGRDVFGEEIIPEPPPGAELAVGENVEMAADGRQCTASVCGYAVLRDGVVSILPPLWIARDLLRAFFVWLPQEAETSAEPEDLSAMLEQAGVVHGIDEQAIAELCGRMHRTGTIARTTLIARGTDAVPGRDAEWVYPFEPTLTKYYGEIRRILHRSPRVEYLEEYGQDLASKVVATGEVLATKKLGEKGKAGIDVFGEEFLPEEPGDAQLELGDFLKLSPAGDTCSAEIYGYVGVGQQRIELISPLWVAPDKMAAYFVNFPSLGERSFPSRAEVQHLLTQAGVCYGIDKKAIVVLCEKMQQGLSTDFTVALARGKASRAGEDSRFEFYMDVDLKSGLFREDGTVDFKALNMALLVDKGQAIGELHPPVAGVEGRDVVGGVMSADQGCELLVEAGRHVAVVRQDDRPVRYVADAVGELVIVDGGERMPPTLALAVHEKMVIQGDVDYETGNIDFPGSVEVTGSVRSGFSVRAEGNIIVQGHIEDKAEIDCGGNVAVQHGISGAGARVQAGGRIVAKYINAAQIQTGGDLHVAEYIYSASVKADGCVVVVGQSGGERSGSIVGGKTMAGRRVRARRIGSESGEPAQVVAGFDAGLLRQVAKLQKQIDQYVTALNKMKRALEIDKIAGPQMKKILLNLLLKAKGPRRKVIARAASNLMELDKRREQAQRSKRALDEQLEKKALGASIEVEGSVAAKTVLYIGGQSLIVGKEKSEVAQVKFCLEKVGEKTQLRMVAN